jgi:hypothetical protein
MIKNTDTFNWQKLLRFRARNPAFVIGGIIILFVLIFTFLPDPFINLLLKDRLTRAINEAYPEDSIHLGYMHYNFWRNRIGCDSINFITNDYIFKVPTFSVSGIGFLNILFNHDFTPRTLTSLKVDARNIVIDFRNSMEELRLDMLHISIPDSEMVCDSIKYYPLLNDEQFFAKSKFRQTRFRIEITQIQINSLDCFAMLKGNNFNAKKIKIHEGIADIMVNMDKPYDKNSANPKMPNETFASIKEFVNLDSLIIMNGRLKYSERYAVNSKPGIITISKINVAAGEISNKTSSRDTTIIRGEGILMNSTKIKLHMEIPLNSKEFSLQYSGSAGKMEVTELNSFIEPGEHQRIKTGVLESAAFNVNVNSGQASGTLRAEYNDLSIDFINKNTGSDKGFIDKVSSLISKIFVVRGSNLPDGDSSIKIGEIKYTRNPDDYFFQFIWFAVRNGIADVVGFPKK